MLCAFCNCASLMSYINPISHAKITPDRGKKCNKKRMVFYLTLTVLLYMLTALYQY